MLGLGAQEMTWAYGLSGAVGIALAIYLVWALIRAEEL
jgi:K+-transporting ATPase KdpF subunit